MQPSQCVQAIIARAFELLPSPLWGGGWLATGAFISRGETGEGVIHREIG